MLRELGVYGTIVGHSERRQYFGETDETVVRRIAAALEHGLQVIACVGETDAEREAGETEAVLRRQVGAIRDGIPETDDLVIAYEPVWAIGTGKTATPEIAQEAHAFVKSILDVPVLYGGSVKPDNAAELRGPAGRRRRARRRRLARSGIVRDDLPCSFPLVTLVILDGWGVAPPGPGQRRRARRHARVRRAPGALPAHAARGVGRGGRAAVRADGELRGRPPDDRLRAAALPGSDAREPRDRRRLARPRAPCSRRPSRRGRRVHLLGLVSQGGVHSHIDHLRALLDLAPDPTTPGSTPSPTAATSRRTPRSRTWRRCRSSASRPSSGRYYAMDRDNRVERTQKAMDALMQGEGHHAPNALQAVEASYEAGVTDEFIEPVVIDGTPRIEPGDTAIFFNFRPDRARQLSRALLAAGVDLTTMTRYAARHRLPRDLRGADGRGHARRGARRAPGSASCTRRRPRSTPTSRTSSTGASRSRGPARTGSSSRARATCRATTSSRRCRPRSWPTASARRSATVTASG